MKTLAYQFIMICSLCAALLGCGGGSGNGNENQSPPNARSWDMAVPIAAPSESNKYFSPQVVIDANGNVIAVWMQHDVGFYNVWANQYVAGVGWGTATLIETNDGNNYNPEIAMDASGNAIAVWTHDYGTRQRNIWGNRYMVGVGWGTAAPIQTDYGYNNTPPFFPPQIAMDANGNAIVVWTQCNDTPQCNQENIWANRYTTGMGWETAVPIGTSGKYNHNPQIALDANGNAMAVWKQCEDVNCNQASLWANRYAAGTGWETAAPIETDDKVNDAPQVAIDLNGNAIVVWTQQDGARYKIWANRYVAGTGWETAAPIETDDQDNFGPAIAMDGSGNAIVVWTHSDGMRLNVWGKRYVVSKGWETAAPIETDDGINESPQVVMDVNGNAIAVWMHCNDVSCHPNSLWTNRYVAGVGWGTAVPIEANNENSYDLDIAMSTNGNAAAAWKQSNGTQDSLWANQFK